MKGVHQLQAQKGSGIICVLMATGGLLTLMGLVIRYTTYGIDIAHQRVLYEQHYFALRGLLNYGLMMAEKSIDQDLQTIYMDTWLECYKGKILILTDKGTIKVHAQLYIRPEESMSMQHAITKTKIP